MFTQPRYRRSISAGITRFIPVSIIGALLITACGGLPASQPQLHTFKIGVLSPSHRFDSDEKGFKVGMTDRGYIEGKNVDYVDDGPMETPDKQVAGAQKLVDAKVDLILAFGNLAAQAAQKVNTNTNIPIVYMPVIDPIQSGLAQSLSNPGHNSTGIYVGAELYGKQLEWLLKISPNIKRIYVPYDSPNNPATVFALASMKSAAPKLGVELVLRVITSADDVSAAISEMAGNKVDAIALVPGSILVNTRISDLIKASLEQKLPLCATTGDFVNVGALISYAIDDTAAGKQATRLADQILKGTAKAGEIPVETAEYYLSVNLKTAQTIGLTITDDLLLSATTVIR